MSLIDRIGDTIGTSWYAKDRKLAKTFAGVALNRKDYEEMNKGFHADISTLKEKFGTSKEIRNEYWGFGTSSQIASFYAAHDMLVHMKRAGIVFDLDKDENKGAVNKLIRCFGAFASQQGRLPRIIEPYRSHKVIQERAKDYRLELPA